MEGHLARPRFTAISRHVSMVSMVAGSKTKKRRGTARRFFRSLPAGRRRLPGKAGLAAFPLRQAGS
jgi:hypothetical protein